MDYTVKSTDVINWNAKGNERILQNVNNIINTVKNEVPYERLMGRDPKNVDATKKNRNMLIEETYDLIQMYEPRAIVKSVEIEDIQNLVIKVVVSID
jgi:phage baseplate assembly protein W